jgi:hypothetical protein
MLQDATDQATQLILGEYVEWIKRFDVNDYLKNRPMIEKLHEEKQLALAKSVKLETAVKQFEARVHELELDNQKLGLQLQEASRKSLSIFLLSLLATVVIGIGVNIATSAPNNWIGWFMIIAGCLIEGLAFWLTPKGKE